MNFYVMKTIKSMTGLFILLAGFGFFSTANATMWNVDAVLQGTDGGFGFSGFHDASTGSVMSGSSLGSITGTGGIGTFLIDDTTGIGYLDINTWSNGGATGISGSLDFGTAIFGFLDSVSSLGIDFNSPTGTLVDDSIFFTPGDVCCNSGGDDPNSFVDIGGGMAYLTLWGANGWSNGSFNNNGGPTTYGMDLRLQLTSVPEPSTIFLMGIALVMFGFKRFSTKS